MSDPAPSTSDTTAHGRVPVAPPGVSERHVAVIGGWRRVGGEPAPSTATVVSLVGGAKLDLSRSAFPADGTTLTKVSIVGGVNAVVPPGTVVEVHGFNLIGGRRVTVAAPDGPTGPVLRIRAYGLWGGVRVTSA